MAGSGKSQIPEKELGAFFLSETEPGIHFVVCKNTIVTKPHYEELVREMKRHTGGAKTGVIVDLQSGKMFTYDGGQYARTAFDEIVWGAAMIAQTSIARMGIAFFLNVIKPVYPMTAPACWRSPLMSRCAK